MVNGFTLCVLIYGDHLPLAVRCLDSIMARLDINHVRSIRVGLNMVSPRVRSFVCRSLADVSADVQTRVYDAGAFNRLKYPMMRKMFYDEQHPLFTTHLMWFDDDSAITGPPGWFGLAMQATRTADLLGARYKYPAKAQQLAMIKDQLWYAHKPFTPGYKFSFVTGGFWIIKTGIVQRWNYPFPALSHNGGDTLLGELCRQRDYQIRHFVDGVMINADDAGAMSKAPRRGVSLPPVWSADYVPDPDRHNFTTRVYDPREADFTEKD